MCWIVVFTIVAFIVQEISPLQYPTKERVQTQMMEDIYNMVLYGSEFIVDDDDYSKESAIDDMDAIIETLEMPKNIRGIPKKHHKMTCVEKISGPFKTVNSLAIDEANYHPRFYYNISCITTQYSGHHHYLQENHVPQCDPNRKHQCVTTITNLQVFRSDPFNATCWTPIENLAVETGCKCKYV